MYNLAVEGVQFRATTLFSLQRRGCSIHNGRGVQHRRRIQTWLRLSGELVEDDRVEAKKAMLDAYPELRGMYDENDGNTQVLYFRNATATFYSFTSAPETEEF